MHSHNSSFILKTFSILIVPNSSQRVLYLNPGLLAGFQIFSLTIILSQSLAKELFACNERASLFL